MTKTEAKMHGEISLTFILLGAAGALMISFLWLLDLIWIWLLSPAAFAASIATFAFTLLVLFRITHAPALSALAATATIALVVRPLVDLVAWAYDHAPLEFDRAYPFVVFTDWASYREEFEDGLPSPLDYFRRRARALQQLKFVAVATSRDD
jgi:branched-subunit amino acid ABC-type transport system permease component